MYIVTRENQRRTTRVGIFRTKKGARKIVTKMKQRDENHNVESNYYINHECYYLTKVFSERLYQWTKRRNERKYSKLIYKRNKLDRKIRNFKRME